MLYGLIHITRFRRRSIWMFFIFILNAGRPVRWNSDYRKRNVYNSLEMYFVLTCVMSFDGCQMGRKLN